MYISNTVENSITNKKLRAFVIVFLMTSIVMSTYGFGRYLFPIIIPDMMKDIQFSYLTVGLITGGNQICYLSFSYFSGQLTKRISAGILVISSILLCSSILTALYFIENIWIIGILISSLGIFTATSWVPMVNIVTEVVSPDHRSKALGLISSGTSYGLLISGVAVPYILLNYNWQTVWLVFGIFALIIAFLGLLFFIQWNLFADKSKKGKNTEKKSIQLNSTEIRFQIFYLVTIMFFTGLTLVPFKNYIIPYVRSELGFSVELAGQLWSVIGILGICSGFLVGAIADKISIRLTLKLSYLFIVLASFLLSFCPTYFTILLAGFLFGAAFFGIFGLIPSYISKIIPSDNPAAVFGITNLALGIGSAAGNYLCGWVKYLTGSFIYIFIGILIICFFLIFVLKRLRNDKVAEVNS